MATRYTVAFDTTPASNGDPREIHSRTTSTLAEAEAMMERIGDRNADRPEVLDSLRIVEHTNAID